MFFLPINDTEPNRYGGPPLVTLTLVLVNILVMIYASLLDYEQILPLYRLFGSVPLLVVSGQGGGALSSITSTFLHGGLFHLVGNMVFLWVFGRRVEDACGPWRFLAFYLFCGLSGDLLRTLVEYKDDIPGIGASGAIAGLLGAYLLLFPGGRIRALFLIFVVPTFPRIRAIWFLLYWVGVQIIPAIEILRSEASYSVAYWAHLGGFFAGAFIIFFLRPEAFSRYLSNEPV
jgi:membrane associated rhomboid family serine protease